jgi:CheY-like chemotaxis protein
VELFLRPSPELPAKPDFVKPGLPASRAAGEVVLVVEDEPSVREVATESLRELGYATLTAADGREALSVLKSAQPVDVLFSDIVMPGGIDGVRLAREARRLRPGLGVLLTSGFAASGGSRDVPRDMPLLTKPYDRAQLSAQLWAVLRNGGQDTSG